MGLKEEIKDELVQRIIPFWQNQIDDENGGYYGYLSFDLIPDKTAVKGCILNSRILWFFSNAYLLLKDDELLINAKQAYTFFRNHCLDNRYGGVYWSVEADGRPYDTTKHTYNQAFIIYALASYYDASKDNEALIQALDLFHLIESRCKDDLGYQEAFTREFSPESNEKLSENGILADRTMNTLLHILEAYSELYRVSKNEEVKDRIKHILFLFKVNLFNKDERRLDVFFNLQYENLINLKSYGHDIEAAWLIDRATELIGDASLIEDMNKVTNHLEESVYQKGYRDHSIMNECEGGVNNTLRIWWVQAEGMVGFMNAWQKHHDDKYYDAMQQIWTYIKTYLIDKRNGSEWFWEVDETGVASSQKPIIELWKCPYHNGRMCIEMIRRLSNEQ